MQQILDLRPRLSRRDESIDRRRLGQVGRRRRELERLFRGQGEELPQAHLGHRHLALPASHFGFDGGERREGPELLELGRLADLEQILDARQVAAAELALGLDRRQAFARRLHAVVGLGGRERRVELCGADLGVDGLADDLRQVNRGADLAESPDRLFDLDHRPAELLGRGREAPAWKLVEDLVEVGAVEKGGVARLPPRRADAQLREGVGAGLADAALHLGANLLDRQQAGVGAQRRFDGPHEVEVDGGGRWRERFADREADDSCEDRRQDMAGMESTEHWFWTSCGARPERTRKGSRPICSRRLIVKSYRGVACLFAKVRPMSKRAAEAGSAGSASLLGERLLAGALAILER